jgi:hypothetical protein
MPGQTSFISRIKNRVAYQRNLRRIAVLNQQVAIHAVTARQDSPNNATAHRGTGTFVETKTGQAPVVFFNASARLAGLSQNAAFALLTSWGLRLAGAPVVHFVCEAGMLPCVQGTNRQDYTQPPPCQGCIALSKRLYAGATTHPFTYVTDQSLVATLEGLSIAELTHYQHPFSIPGNTTTVIPLGRLVIPSLRWALRRHHLPDDEPTRYLLRQYLLSAYRVANEFTTLLQKIQPSATIIFNGIMYPEAVARWVARQLGVRDIAHEVGFQPYSAFFTDGEPTAYPIHIPDDFELTDEQNARLDAYLERRFQGKFSMAGIRFWPEMHSLDATFLEKAAAFRQIVPVFTNVIYDTSQIHANKIYDHMFAWLEDVRNTIINHPETLFVIRAHPDEMRPGTAKQSKESVRDWVERNQVSSRPNVIFIDSQEYLSSYELIQRSKFVMVYNSSIGMEAALLGAAVLCGGKARYTQYPIVFFPGTRQEHQELSELFLINEKIIVPPEFQRNARRFLYYQLYRASLPFDGFLQASARQGFVEFKPFSWERLLPWSTPGMQVLVDGILHGAPLLLPETG